VDAVQIGKPVAGSADKPNTAANNTASLVIALGRMPARADTTPEQPAQILHHRLPRLVRRRRTSATAPKPQSPEG
jgi:hypothetical protein